MQKWDSISRTQENINIFRHDLENKFDIEVTGGILSQTNGDNGGGTRQPHPVKFNPNQ